MQEWIDGVKDKYPPQLLDKRINAEGNVIGLIYNDPLLLDEVSLSDQDFLSVEGKLYFGIAQELRRYKVNDFSEVAIMSHIDGDLLSEFQERGGYRAISDIAERVSIRNKDAILDALAKYNVMLRLYDNGFNLLTPVEIGKKKVAPIEFFKGLDSNEILDWYNVQLSKLGGGYDMTLLEDADLEITDEFIDSLVKGDGRGVDYAIIGQDVKGEEISIFPFLNNQTLGLSAGASHYIAGFSSSGKTAMMCSIILGLLHSNEKVLIICNEQSSRVWKLNWLSLILYKYFRHTSLTKSHLQNGKFSDTDLEVLRQAKDKLNEIIRGNVHFVQLAGNDMNVVKAKIRFYALQHGYSTVVYDTFKVSDTDRRNKDVASWEEIVQASRDLDIYAKRYNLIMLCSMQLAQSNKGALFLDSNMLSGAKGTVEQLDTLLCIRDVYKEELDPNSKYYCAPYELVKNEVTGKWERKDYICDPNDSWKFVFLAKSRNSENSTSSQTALMYRFLGKYAVFEEKCHGRPKHGYIQ